MHLAKWTLGFVVVTQLALVVVTRLASEATVDGQGGGLSAYTYAYAVWILPHSLITVSLATAMLPSASRLAAVGDRVGVADETTRTIRLAVTALLPAAVAFLVLGLPAAQLLFGFGQGASDAAYVGIALDGAGHRPGAVHRAVRLPARLLRVGGHPLHVLPAVRDRRRQRGLRRRRRDADRPAGAGRGRSRPGLLDRLHDRCPRLLPEATPQAAGSGRRGPGQALHPAASSPSLRPPRWPG